MFSFINFYKVVKNPLYPLPNLPASLNESFHSFIESISCSSNPLYILESFFAIECLIIFSICTKTILFHSNLFTNPSKIIKIFYFSRNLPNS